MSKTINNTFKSLKTISLLALLILPFISSGQWMEQVSGTTQKLNGIYFTDANTGFAVGENGVIQKNN